MATSTRRFCSIQWTTLVFLIVCVNGRYSHKSNRPANEALYTVRQSVGVPGHSYGNESLAISSRSVTFALAEAKQVPNGCGSTGESIPCSSLDADCIECHLNDSCVYGEELTVSCTARPGVDCIGAGISFERHMICRYCYQTIPGKEHVCERNASCQVNSSPRQRYQAHCHVRPNVICLGRRGFMKNHLCNWTRGYSWRTALLLSVVLGGFGADRFYLGMWQEGIGKLFSFGGLGVWTLVDVVLVATGYLGPADGSLYLD